MGTFAMLLGYGLGLLPSIVLGIQTVAGDAAAGATKKQMAQDALAVALQGAAGVIPSGSVNGVLVQASGAVAGQTINAVDAIAQVLAHLGKHDAVTTAVNLTKATGAYQEATAAAKASQAAPVAPAA